MRSIKSALFPLHCTITEKCLCQHSILILITTDDEHATIRIFFGAPSLPSQHKPTPGRDSHQLSLIIAVIIIMVDYHTLYVVCPMYPVFSCPIFLPIPDFAVGSSSVPQCRSIQWTIIHTRAVVAPLDSLLLLDRSQLICIGHRRRSFYSDVYTRIGSPSHICVCGNEHGNYHDTIVPANQFLIHNYCHRPQSNHNALRTNREENAYNTDSWTKQHTKINIIPINLICWYYVYILYHWNGLKRWISEATYLVLSSNRSVSAITQLEHLNCELT